MNAADFAEQIGGFRREVAGMIRRMTIGRSGSGVWQALGHLLLDAVTVEGIEVETYPGIGIFARPPDGSGEMIMVNVAGPNQPAAVAMRDEATRAKVDDISGDESTLYNSLARVYVKKDGTVEIRTHAGVAVPLALLSDVSALRGTFNAHVHSGVTTGAGSSAVSTTTAAAPVGTTKLKGE